MSLESLHHMVWIETRIFVIESRNKTEGDDVVLAAVNPRAAIFVRGQRPSHRVDDLTRSDAASGNLPKLLYSYTVCLRIAIFIEIESSDELFGERSARSFAQDGDFCL